MRLRFAFAAAQSLSLFLASEAFTPTSWRASQPRLVTSLHAAGSFENDDFLDSLKGSNPSGDDDAPSDDMRAKSKANDESFGGGSRFKQMLEKAQKVAVSAEPMSLKNPFAENPFAGIEGVDPAATPRAAPVAGVPPISFDNMTVEQQAQMFRAMMQGQPVQPAFQVPVAKAKPDRKVGRNRDADAIQNTADVYFAQLKRDSTVRGIARLLGDDEKANAVFKDPKIKELEELISDNPHLKGKREEEQKLIEAAAEEMLAYQQALDVRPQIQATTGARYREKLAQRRNKAGGGDPAASTPPAYPTERLAPQKPVPAPESRKAEEPVSRTATPEPAALPKVEEPVAKVATPEPPAQPKVEEPVAVAAPAEAAAAPQQSTSSVTTSSSPDEIRTAIRTLMGLILKHRGGPGFGAGGLKGAEIGKYEKLMNDMTALLKEEAQAYHTGPTAAVAPAAATVPQPPIAFQAPATPQVPAMPQAPATPQASFTGLATVPTSPSGAAQIDGMLNCIDGAILMYRNSPQELKESMLMTVRAALLSAVNTCNKVMGQNEGIPSTTGAGTNIDTMFACIEGAIKMYRNSPPELQQGVLLTVRAALLSAIGTCNKIVAENDLQNFMDYKEATVGMNMPQQTPKPVQFYDVVAQEEETETSWSTSVGDDANSVVLENIYNKMEAAAGKGKFGLREDLTAEEASELADSIAEMRSIMMEELNNGIPRTAGAAVTSSGSTTSMYQKMLEKAKAEKAARS